MAAESGHHYTVKELPSDERPRERLLAYGSNAVSLAELLAIILRTGSRDENVINMAHRLLRDYGGLSGLAKANATELAGIKGLGPAKVAQLKAALELALRLRLEAPEERAQIRSPADAANLVLTEMGLLEQEELRIILLDTKNRVLEKKTVYKGSLHTSLIRVGELFREAVRANCASLIVLHNHPSGDPTPSPEDVAVTKQLVEAGHLLDIDVLDHLIIGHQRFVSLKERGLGFG